jgi:hypothetical protein
MKQFIDIINKMTAEEPVLTEAQNYAAIFNPLWTMTNKLSPDFVQNGDLSEKIDKFKSAVPGFIQSAKRTLKKNDRIVWFLKLTRLSMAADIYNKTNFDEFQFGRVDTSASNNLNVLDSFINKEKSELSMAHVNNGRIFTLANLVHTAETLAHYFSLPIPEIQNTVFTNQNPSELLGKFSEYERDWKDRQNQILTYPTEEEANFEILIKFPDGKMWVNLNKAYCETEGKAMGHCGNKAAYKADDTLLSLREPIKHGTETKMRPLLTFILHADGNLGEMKGRGNQKPAPQYHNYIIELLKLPIIKGIVGGGYAPERNFALTDLPEADQNALVEMKPSLGSLAYQYRRFGLSDSVMGSIKNKIGDLGINVDANNITYDAASTLFTVDELPLSEFIDEYVHENSRRNNNSVKYAFEVVTGETFIETSDWADKSNVENLMDELPDDLKAGLTAHCLKNYPNSFNEDGTTDESLYNILDENDDDLLEEFRRAVEDGMRSGTETEIYEDLQYCLKEWSANGFHLQRDSDGSINLHDPVKLVITAKDLIDNLSNADYCEIAANDGKWFDVVDGPRLDEPRYGWSGMNDDAAFDYLRDNTDLLTKAKEEKEEAKEAIDFIKKRI